MTEFPLRLDRYFFTQQEVTANPDFVQDEDNNDIYIIEGNAQRLVDHDHVYGITAHVELNAETSVNPPYFFSITAFGVILVKDGSVGQAAIESIIENSGAQLLLGAIRERLADMTARGPWASINLDFIPLAIKLDS
ncbi:MAG TPA: hypothetical protein VIF37_08565 [Methylobacter sp.]|jgi:preprotein translocase subunit SecB